MKLAFVFLACFVGITWQQEVFVRQSPQGFYYHVNNYAHQYPAYHQQAFQQPAYQQYVQQPAPQQYIQLAAEQQHYQPANDNQHVYHQSDPVVEALPYPVIYANPYGEDGAGKQLFQLFNRPNRPFRPINQLLNNLFGGGIIRPQNNRPPVTVFVTSMSMVTAESATTCLTRTMFAATTACRRRRSILDIISADDLHADEAPTPSEPLKSAIEELPREGRDVDAAYQIQSSKQDFVDELDAPYYYYANPSDAVAEEFLRQRRRTVTSTVVSFSITTVFKTRTNTNLAGPQALSCVPAGQILC